MTGKLFSYSLKIFFKKTDIHRIDHRIRFFVASFIPLFTNYYQMYAYQQDQKAQRFGC